MDPRLIPIEYELRAACELSDVNQVTKMLDSGASPNCSDREGNTPLMIACKTGNKKIAELLINRRADLNVRNKVGDTALNIACREGQSIIVELLLENNADPNARPYDSALCSDSPLTTTCRKVDKCNLQIIKQLLAAGADPTQTNQLGHSPFMVACWNNHPDVVSLFLAKNVNLNAVDVNRNTALHKAVEWGFYRKKVILMLVGAGADLTIKNNDGYTAPEKDMHGVIAWAQKQIQNQSLSLRQRFSHLFSAFSSNNGPQAEVTNSQHHDFTRNTNK